MPDGEQQRDMRRFSGACRFVFNKALALQKANMQAGENFISYVAMAKRLTDWRNGSETPWLKDAPCHPLQHALKDLERAYKNFSKGFDRQLAALLEQPLMPDRSYCLIMLDTDHFKNGKRPARSCDG